MTQVKLMTWHKQVACTLLGITPFSSFSGNVPPCLQCLIRKGRIFLIFCTHCNKINKLTSCIGWWCRCFNWNPEWVAHCWLSLVLEMDFPFWMVTACVFTGPINCVDKTYRIAVDQIHSRCRGTVRPGILQLTVCFLIFSIWFAYQLVFTWFFQCKFTWWTWRYKTCLLGNILVFNWPDLATAESFLFKSLRLCLLRGHFTLSQQSQNVKKKKSHRFKMSTQYPRYSGFVGKYRFHA